MGITGATPGYRHVHARLTQAARAAFDKMRRVTPRLRMAKLLGVSEYTITNLEDDGTAIPPTIAKVHAALERVGAM